MFRSKKLTKIILANFLVLVLCLAFLAIVPPAISDIYFYLQKMGLFSPNTTKDPRAFLPNYKNSEWSSEHFQEFNALESQYFDYIGWRRKSFSGKTININHEGYRQDPQSKATTSRDAQIWVFGGSTVWGSGARDFETIPAFLEQASQLATFNFGESGYVAHQNLNLLMKAYLNGGHPKYVIFYDGVNEVLHKCRAQQTFYSTAYEGKIRWQIEESLRISNHSLARVFSPSFQLIQKLFNSEASTSEHPKYTCAQDPKKTQKIAEGLANDWKTARYIVESNGGKFLAVLQPNAYTGHPNLKHLQSVVDDTDLRQQFDTVYPTIRKTLEHDKFPYHDLSDALDGSQYFYIDAYHVSPNGNEVIASKIAQALAGRPLRD